MGRKRQNRCTALQPASKMRRVTPTSEYLKRITSLLLTAATDGPVGPAEVVTGTYLPPAWFDNEARSQWAEIEAIECDALFKAPLFAPTSPDFSANADSHSGATASITGSTSEAAAVVASHCIRSVSRVHDSFLRHPTPLSPKTTAHIGCSSSSGSWGSKGVLQVCPIRPKRVAT